MKRFFSRLIPLIVLGCVTSASGQEEAASKGGDILKAIQVPQTAQAARDAGVPQEDVEAVLKEAKGKKTKAGEIQEGLDEAVKATKEHGPIDNFGTFVKSKLDEGLRGRALAEAIRKEHAARGIGKGKRLGKATEAGGKGRGRDAAKPRSIVEDEDEKEKNSPGQGRTQGKSRGQGKGRGAAKSQPGGDD